MDYNFDEIIERKGTSCVKHDMMSRDFGGEDFLPMWVADMDFRTPPFIMDAVRERCNHDILGYTYADRKYYEAIMWWMERHYNIKTEKKEIHYIPGIVAGIAFAIQVFTNIGDKILVTVPVYPPFINLPKAGGRKVVTTPLFIKNDKFNINFKILNERIKGCKMMILSNPHNPGGTIWTHEELDKIANICHKNNCLLISDEIHADLTLFGHKHNSFSTISDIAKNISITFLAPSKTFNIPGLSSSIAYIPNEDLRKKYFKYIDGYELANGNLFAYIGVKAAYTQKGEEWLEQLKKYLEGNVKYMKDFFDKNMPLVRYVAPDASYLAWINLKQYGIAHEDMFERLLDIGKIALNDGTNFGLSNNAFKGFFRLNLGCPKIILEDALDRLYKTFGRGK